MKDFCYKIPLDCVIKRDLIAEIITESKQVEINLFACHQKFANCLKCKFWLGHIIIRLALFS